MNLYILCIVSIALKVSSCQDNIPDDTSSVNWREGGQIREEEVRGGDGQGRQRAPDPSLRGIANPNDIHKPDGFKPLTDHTNLDARRRACEEEEDRDCKDICLAYLEYSVDIVFCTRRRKELFQGYRTSRVFYYWTIHSCVTHNVAEMACRQGGGTVAAFKDGSDRVFASGYLSGLSNYGPYCFNGQDASSPNLNLVWAGLKSDTSSSPWRWSDGSKVSVLNPVAWNQDLPLYYKEKMHFRNNNALCGVVGYNGIVWDPPEYAQGFEGINCDGEARAVCVKEVPTWH